jgi:hypothetical protein
VSDTPARGDPQADVLVINRVPTSAIQALYHAATGKTENLEKRLTKNFIVRKPDLEQLYFKVLQQLEHFERVAGPTITVKVGFHNNEHQQFSSWERFRIFDAGRAEVVSDVVIKFEFLIRLPEQLDPQRYVLNIDVDSKLPMVIDEEKRGYGIFHFFFGLEKLPSLTVSIDFIDYLCAKNFVQIVEDWFNVLEESPTSKWYKRFTTFQLNWRFTFSKFANIGAAIFIALYAYLNRGDVGNLTQIIYLGSVAIVAWTISLVLCAHIGNLFESLISKSFIPAAIVLTTGDERAFKKVQERARNVPPKMALYGLTIVGTIGLNVLASYLYAWMTRK